MCVTSGASTLIPSAEVANNSYHLNLVSISQTGYTSSSALFEEHEIGQIVLQLDHWFLPHTGYPSVLFQTRHMNSHNTSILCILLSLDRFLFQQTVYLQLAMVTHAHFLVKVYIYTIRVCCDFLKPNSFSGLSTNWRCCCCEC